jgi:shikimate dehydrogenase
MKFGILAYPAKHSLSPAFFNSIFKKLGIDAEYVFFDVPPEELESFISGVKGSDEVRGMSVSTPHKETVMAFLDEIAEDAKMIGAVNTILNKDGKLYGFNADYVGAMAALKEKVKDLKGKKVIVLGAGGAARAVIYGLLKEGAEVCVLNRTVSKAKRLSDHFGNVLGLRIEYGDLSSVSDRECDVLINTTSTWMITGLDVVLVPKEFFKKEMVVMDIVYKPLITPLLTDAMEAGCEIVTGETMFKYQAERQYEIWFGEKMPI